MVLATADELAAHDALLAKTARSGRALTGPRLWPQAPEPHSAAPELMEAAELQLLGGGIVLTQSLLFP